MLTETNFNLTDGQMNEYEEIFTYFDRKNTGRIDVNDLGLIIRSAGLNPSDMKLKEIQDDYERNKINEIDFQQFLQILINLTNEIDDEIDLIEAFRVFDKEGQGNQSYIHLMSFITKEELFHIVTHLGEKLTSEEAEEMMEDADIYCDGKIRYEEFVKVMTELN
ncbi:unnamed protein product [Adineta ricciae]|uniref:EF-hand domain-containing protein n=1 Tax=Adineta ricciae TaxID=249248 RepID=A0A815BBG1_ADIRI|nr:unnamed protein product [Adineta ricciae]